MKLLPVIAREVTPGLPRRYAPRNDGGKGRLAMTEEKGDSQ